MAQPNPHLPFPQPPAQPPMMSQTDRLLAPKPAPQGELRPWDSKVAKVGAYLEDNAGMRDLGKVVQNAGLGSFEGIRPDQLVRAGTDVAMLAPQVGTTGRAIAGAAKAAPVLYQGLKQGIQAALPALAKAAPAIGNAAIESAYLASALTGNQQLGDLATMARGGQNGLRALTSRRDLDIGRQGVSNKALFGNERDQLAAALRMARNGEQNMERIRQQTGWRTLPGQEGSKPQWAYEIADDQARIAKGPDGPMSAQLDHPQLYDHYPEAGFIDRRANIDLGEARGKMMPDRGAYGQGLMEYNPIHPDMGTEAQQRANSLHELQHWIQKKEGWETGGTPYSAAAQDAANSKMEDLFASGHLNYNMPIDDLVKTQDKLAREAYWNMAGEAHARSTAARMAMTPAQRRGANPMEVSYDRTPEELVYQR